MLSFSVWIWCVTSSIVLIHDHLVEVQWFMFHGSWWPSMSKAAMKIWRVCGPPLLVAKRTFLQQNLKVNEVWIIVDLVADCSTIRGVVVGTSSPFLPVFYVLFGPRLLEGFPSTKLNQPKNTPWVDFGVCWGKGNTWPISITKEWAQAIVNGDISPA